MNPPANQGPSVLMALDPGGELWAFSSPRLSLSPVLSAGLGSAYTPRSRTAGGLRHASASGHAVARKMLEEQEAANSQTWSW